MKGLKVMKKFVSILLVFTLASTLLFAMTAFAADKNPVYYMLIGKKDCTKLDVFNQSIVSETGTTVCLTGAYVNYVTDYEKMMNLAQAKLRKDYLKLKHNQSLLLLIKTQMKILFQDILMLEQSNYLF